jgi:hypothetical protein
MSLVTGNRKHRLEKHWNSGDRGSKFKGNRVPVSSGEADRLDLDGDTDSDGDEFVSPAIVPAAAESAPPPYSKVTPLRITPFEVQAGHS